MISPAEIGFELSATPPDAAGPSGAMFDILSVNVFEHLRRYSLSAQNQQSAPLPAVTAAHCQMRG